MTYQIVQWVSIPVVQNYVPQVQQLPQVQQVQQVQQVRVQPVQNVQTVRCVPVQRVQRAPQVQARSQVVVVGQATPPPQNTPPQQPVAAPVLSPTPKTPRSKVQFSYVDSKLTPLRVSGRTKASGLAGAIAKRLRMCQSVAVEAMGAESVATTTTALALAKTFVAVANLSMLVQVESIYAPSRSDEEEADHPGLRFMVSATLEEEAVKYTHDMVRKVHEGAQVAKVAGSISKMVRGGEERVINMALEGASSQLLNTAVKSIALSRAMLQDDGLDIVFQPQFKGADKRNSSIDITVLSIPRKPETTHTFLPSSVPSSEHTGSDRDSEHDHCFDENSAPPALLPEDVMVSLREYLEATE